MLIRHLLNNLRCLSLRAFLYVKMLEVNGLDDWNAFSVQMRGGSDTVCTYKRGLGAAWQEETEPPLEIRHCFLINVQTRHACLRFSLEPVAAVSINGFLFSLHILSIGSEF